MTVCADADGSAPIAGGSRDYYGTARFDPRMPFRHAPKRPHLAETGIAALEGATATSRPSFPGNANDSLRTEASPLAVKLLTVDEARPRMTA